MSADRLYKDGDIVWIKLRNHSWWPGEVTDGLREQFRHFKKKPYCVVKFFNEDTFEYVNSAKKILPFQCSKKEEFIKKGLAMYEAKNKFMEKFPSSVHFAEKLTHNINLVKTRPNSIIKAVLSKPILDMNNDSDSETISTPKQKDTSLSGNSKDSSIKILNITPNRVVPMNVSHPMMSFESRRNSIANTCGNLYKCGMCEFTSIRQNVIVLHRKSHGRIQQTMGPPLSGGVSANTSPAIKSKNLTQFNVPQDVRLPYHNKSPVGKVSWTSPNNNLISDFMAKPNYNLKRSTSCEAMPVSTETITLERKPLTAEKPKVEKSPKVPSVRPKMKNFSEYRASTRLLRSSVTRESIGSLNALLQKEEFKIPQPAALEQPQIKMKEQPPPPPPPVVEKEKIEIVNNLDSERVESPKLNAEKIRQMIADDWSDEDDEYDNIVKVSTPSPTPLQKPVAADSQSLETKALRNSSKKEGQDKGGEDSLNGKTRSNNSKNVENADTESVIVIEDSGGNSSNISTTGEAHKKGPNSKKLGESSDKEQTSFSKPSCFDFEEEEEEESDILTSIAKFKKKYYSSESKNNQTANKESENVGKQRDSNREQKATDVLKRDLKLADEINRLLQQTASPESDKKSCKKEIVELPIKERSKRIFKSRNSLPAERRTIHITADNDEDTSDEGKEENKVMTKQKDLSKVKDSEKPKNKQNTLLKEQTMKDADKTLGKPLKTGQDISSKLEKDKSVPAESLDININRENDSDDKPQRVETLSSSAASTTDLCSFSERKDVDLNDNTNSSNGISDTGAEFGSPISMLDEDRLLTKDNVFRGRPVMTPDSMDSKDNCDINTESTNAAKVNAENPSETGTKGKHLKEKSKLLKDSTFASVRDEAIARLDLDEETRNSSTSLENYDKTEESEYDSEASGKSKGNETTKDNEGGEVTISISTKLRYSKKKRKTLEQKTHIRKIIKQVSQEDSTLGNEAIRNAEKDELVVGSTIENALNNKNIHVERTEDKVRKTITPPSSSSNTKKTEGKIQILENKFLSPFKTKNGGSQSNLPLENENSFDKKNIKQNDRLSSNAQNKNLKQKYLDSSLLPLHNVDHLSGTQRKEKQCSDEEKVESVFEESKLTNKSDSIKGENVLGSDVKSLSATNCLSPHIAHASEELSLCKEKGKATKTLSTSNTEMKTATDLISSHNRPIAEQKKSPKIKEGKEIQIESPLIPKNPQSKAPCNKVLSSTKDKRSLHQQYPSTSGDVNAIEVEKPLLPLKIDDDNLSVLQPQINHSLAESSKMQSTSTLNKLTESSSKNTSSLASNSPKVSLKRPRETSEDPDEVPKKLLVKDPFVVDTAQISSHSPNSKQHQPVLKRQIGTDSHGNKYLIVNTQSHEVTSPTKKNQTPPEEPPKIMAVPTMPIPGYSDTFLLCTLVNNNYKPIDNTPLYLDHASNQLVPVPEEALKSCPARLGILHPPENENQTRKDDEPSTSSNADSFLLRKESTHEGPVHIHPEEETSSISSANQGSSEDLQENILDSNMIVNTMEGENENPNEYLSPEEAQEIVANNAVILTIEGQQIILDTATFAHLLANPDSNTQLITEDGNEFILTREVLLALQAQHQQQDEITSVDSEANLRLGEDSHEGQFQQELEVAQAQEIAVEENAPGDILTVALDSANELYDASVLQIETATEGGLQIIDGDGGSIVFPVSTVLTPPNLTPPISAVTSETNALLDQTPIMSTLENPSTSRKKPSSSVSGASNVICNSRNLLQQNIDVESSKDLSRPSLEDSLAVIGVSTQPSNVPSSLELPITVTNPNIAPPKAAITGNLTSDLVDFPHVNLTTFKDTAT